MGGQVGDIGTITINGKAANVVNTTKTEDGYYLHETEVQLTPIKVGDTVTMSVDKVHRTDVCRNHTATHILDKALRDVLGHTLHKQVRLLKVTDFVLTSLTLRL